MKVVYLTWGETPRSYGVFGSQVIKQFVETKKLMPEAEFSFLSAIPLIHSGMIREKLNYSNELNKVCQDLVGISFSRIPIYAPQNFVNASRFTFPLMHHGAHFHLAKTLSKNSPNIVHCRGYGATYAALKVRNKYKLNYKIIFDARGLWPEEVSLKKGYNEESKNYLYLKKIEQWILDNSDCVIAVSDPMLQHLKKLTNTDIETVYLSASTESFQIQSKNKDSNEATLIYVGALSDDTWHKPKNLADVYSAFRLNFEKSKLIIVSTSNHHQIKAIFKQFPENEIELTSTKTQSELAKILSKADLSCLSYFTPQTDRERTISDTVLAVKTAEYLSAGLPMLCNKYCGGAAYFVNKNSIGLTYNPENLNNITKEKLELLLDESVSKKAIEVSKRNFSYSENANKYKNIYQSLL